MANQAITKDVVAFTNHGSFIILTSVERIEVIRMATKAVVATAVYSSANLLRGDGGPVDVVIEDRIVIRKAEAVPTRRTLQPKNVALTILFRAFVWSLLAVVILLIYRVLVS